MSASPPLSGAGGCPPQQQPTWGRRGTCRSDAPTGGHILSLGLWWSLEAAWGKAEVLHSPCACSSPKKVVLEHRSPSEPPTLDGSLPSAPLTPAARLQLGEFGAKCANCPPHSLRGVERCWLEGRVLASFPTPFSSTSFPHMVLIRSGLRDSSQRKWLCTESFCEGEEGEGERAERKKERKEGRGWGEKVGEAGRLQHSALPSPCRVSATARPCGLLTLPIRNEGPEKNPGSPLTSQLPAGEAGGSQLLPRVLGDP